MALTSFSPFIIVRSAAYSIISLGTTFNLSTEQC